VIKDEVIDRIAVSLKEAYHGDLSDCPILLDAAETLLALKKERSSREEATLAYMLECITVHVEKFPVPSHMRAMVEKVRATLGESK